MGSQLATKPPPPPGIGEVRKFQKRMCLQRRVSPQRGAAVSRTEVPPQYLSDTETEIIQNIFRETH